MNVLVTGGSGFIGSHFIRHWLKQHQGSVITNLDKLTYAAHAGNTSDAERTTRYRHVHGDICNEADVERAFAGAIDAVVHFAAESHVDRSIASPEPFVSTNIEGTFRLLEAARKHGVSRFLHVSTDEVYGSADDGRMFTEQSPLSPNSPYSASKASSDLLVRAYCRTYALPAVITRCSNNYGPNQFPEKLIPKTIIAALNGERIPVYGDGLQVRDWLHVTDHCRALELALLRGQPGEVYNIGGDSELSNMDIVRQLVAATGASESLITLVDDRPGHDRRYAVDYGKIERLWGWSPAISLQDGLRATVDWYMHNRQWWQSIIDGTYLDGRQGGERA